QRLPRKQEAPRDRPAPRRHHRDLALLHLAGPALAPELADRLGEEAEAVEAAAGELPAPGVERQRAAKTHSTSFDEWPAFAALAEAERLDPGEREPAEAVVELDGVDVGGFQVRACPELRGGVARRHGGQVLPLVPHRTAADGAAHGVDVHGG